MARESGLRGIFNPVKIGKRIAIFSAILLAMPSAQAQGIFQNLNFEAANVTGYSAGSSIPVSLALSGWTAYLTDTSTSTVTPESQVVYDGISTGGPVISVIDANSGFAPLQGNYSVFLFGGGAPSVYAASISQRDLIPAGTQTLLMDAWSYNASPVVAINGQTISMIPLQTFADSSAPGGYYTLYGGNISSFADTTATLSFTDPPPTSDAPSFFLLDNISFSPTPEPSIVSFTAIGGLVFGVRKWFARR